MIKSFGTKKRHSRIFIYTLVVLLLLLLNDLLPRPHLGWAKFLCGTEKYKKTKRTFRLFYVSLTKTNPKKKEVIYENRTPRLGSHFPCIGALPGV